MIENNLNENAEPFKSIAYSMKDLEQQQRNVNQKILRALRNHEKRLSRLEAHLKINISSKELNNIGEDE